MPAPAIYLLFFLSGISGLVYQVIWVREFGFVFGNTVHSAATITAVFIAGLGLGSLAVGRWSDRRHQAERSLPVRAYGIFEIGIAVLGSLMALILPGLEGFSASFSHYVPGAEGWFEITTTSHLLRFATAVLLLAPITFLMGGTLTLLVRSLVVGNLASAGWRIGRLYGLNTAGAACGAFLSDFALIPAFGIRGAQMVAITLNVIAGLGAILLVYGQRAHSPTSSAPAAASGRAGPDRNGRLLLLGTALTLFASGFVAMGLEIVWFRYLISRLYGLRAVFSLLLTVILVGIFLGSVFGGYLDRRFKTPARHYLLAQTALVVFALAPLFVLGPGLFGVVNPRPLLEAVESYRLLYKLAEAGINLQSIVAVVGLPALLMGCTFPLANAHVQRVEEAVGSRAGTLYLANTLGNMAGSLLTGFLLLPSLGQQGSITLLGAFGALGLVPLYLTSARRRDERREWVPVSFFIGCIAVLFFSLGSWLTLPPNHLVRHVRASDHARVLAISEGINENVVVVAGSRGRTLYTNGHTMSSTTWTAQRYMRLFSHVPLLSAESPQLVLVICFGVGTTLHAASLHSSIERLEVVDLSKNVISHAHYFSPSNRNVLEDQRVSVFINDGRQHLRMRPPHSYDLITLESPPISLAGVAALYSTEFYALARSRLRDDGFMTQWLPAYQASTDVTLSMIRSFIEVFPNAALLSGSGRELILIGSTGSGPHLRLDRVRDRLGRDRRLSRELEAIGAGSPTALAATFVAGPRVLKRATREVPPVTDDRPMMEYSIGANFYSTRLPESIFDASELHDWCPGCFDGEKPIEELRELPKLMDALETLYKSEIFLEYSNFRDYATSARRPIYLKGDPCRLSTVRGSIYFNQLFECVPLFAQ